MKEPGDGRKNDEVWRVWKRGEKGIHSRHTDRQEGKGCAVFRKGENGEAHTITPPSLMSDAESQQSILPPFRAT